MRVCLHLPALVHALVWFCGEVMCFMSACTSDNYKSIATFAMNSCAVRMMYYCTEHINGTTIHKHICLLVHFSGLTTSTCIMIKN